MSIAVKKMREEYFRLRQFEDASNVHNTLDRALSFLKHTENPDYEAALMLFDTASDRRDPDWLSLIGHIYNSLVNHPYFNPEDAVVFYRQAMDYIQSDPEKYMQYHEDGAAIFTALLKKFPKSPVDKELASFRNSNDYIENFLKALVLIRQKQFNLLGRQKYENAGDFFREKYNIPHYELFDRISRIKLFEEFYKEGKYDDAVMALDPMSDLINADVCHGVGWIFQNSDTQLFNPEISESVFFYGAVQFAEKNETMCAFRLGHFYMGGYNGRIDYNAALFWHNIALKLGHGVAPKFIYEILASQDERARDPNNVDFQKYLDDLMNLAESMGFPCSQEWITKKYAFGSGKYNDQKRVIQAYENTLNGNFFAPPQLKSLMAYAMRGFIFGGNKDSYEKVISSIRINTEKGKLQSYYTSELEIPLRELDRLHKKIHQDKHYKSVFVDAVTLIKKFYLSEITREEFFSSTENAFKERSNATEIYRDALWLGRTLAATENWKIVYDIAQAFENINANYLGLNLITLKKSALMMGPFYNPLDPKNALPILGEYLPASVNDEDIEVQRVTFGAFVPSPGIVSVNAIIGEQNGSIRFEVSEDSVSPALILQEDINVAMALAFGAAKPIWPGLSLEKKYAREDLQADEYEQFSTKVWEPEWLGHTDYGKTLYIVDRLTGQLTWSPRSFTVARPEDAVDPNFPSFVKNLIEELVFTGGIDKTAHSKLINVSPEYIPLFIQKMKIASGKEEWRIALKKIKMRVNGSYILTKENGHEDRSIGWNNTDYLQGRLTQKLTDHYSDIALMMPVFERARQISGLTYGLIKLREEGFRLGEQFRIEAAETIDHYKKLPRLRKNILVMKAQPFNIDFI